MASRLQERLQQARRGSEQITGRERDSNCCSVRQLGAVPSGGVQCPFGTAAQALFFTVICTHQHHGKISYARSTPAVLPVVMRPQAGITMYCLPRAV